MEMTNSQMDATLQAVAIRCVSIKETIRECTSDAKRPDDINMDQITVLTRQYNDLQQVMVNLITNGASYG